MFQFLPVNSVNKSKFVFTPQLHRLSCKVYLDSKKSVKNYNLFILFTVPHVALYFLFKVRGVHITGYKLF